MSTLDIFIFQMFWRCVRLAKASETLILTHQSEEALFLARSLFEDSLRLSDLASSAKSERNALLLGWAIASTNEGKGLAHVAVDAGLAKTADSLQSTFDGQLAQLRRYAARNGDIKPRKFRSVRDAAHAHGRQEALWTYALAHEMVHGSDISFLFNRRRLDEGAIAVHLQRPDFDLETGISCFCAESVLHSAIAFAHMFNCQGVDALRDQVLEITSLQEILVAKREQQDA